MFTEDGQLQSTEVLKKKIVSENFILKGMGKICMVNIGIQRVNMFSTIPTIKMKHFYHSIKKLYLDLYL